MLKESNKQTVPMAEIRSGNGVQNDKIGLGPIALKISACYTKKRTEIVRFRPPPPIRSTGFFFQFRSDRAVIAAAKPVMQLRTTNEPSARFQSRWTRPSHRFHGGFVSICVRNFAEVRQIALNWGKSVSREVADSSALTNRLENQIMFRIPSLAPISIRFLAQKPLAITQKSTLLHHGFA